MKTRKTKKRLKKKILSSNAKRLQRFAEQAIGGRASERDAKEWLGFTDSKFKAAKKELIQSGIAERGKGIRLW